MAILNSNESSEKKAEQLQKKRQEFLRNSNELQQGMWRAHRDICIDDSSEIDDSPNPFHDHFNWLPHDLQQAGFDIRAIQSDFRKATGFFWREIEQILRSNQDEESKQLRVNERLKGVPERPFMSSPPQSSATQSDFKEATDFLTSPPPQSSATSPLPRASMAVIEEAVNIFFENQDDLRAELERRFRSAEQADDSLSQKGKDAMNRIKSVIDKPDELRTMLDQIDEESRVLKNIIQIADVNRNELVLESGRTIPNPFYQMYHFHVELPGHLKKSIEALGTFVREVLAPLREIINNTNLSESEREIQIKKILNTADELLPKAEDKLLTDTY